MDQDAVLDVPGRIRMSLQQTRFSTTVFTGFGLLLDVIRAQRSVRAWEAPFHNAFLRMILLVSETHRLHGSYGTKPL